jgi:quercetin dioxygenase-like cupin family protein
MEKKVVVRQTNEVPAEPMAPGVVQRFVFDHRTPTQNLTVLVGYFESGKGCGLHYHDGEEVFYVISGQGEGILGETPVKLAPGTFMYISAECPHNFWNTGKEELAVMAILPAAKFNTTWLTEPRKNM